MGYEQQTLRNYSVLALLGMGFALTNSWWAISSSMVRPCPCTYCVTSVDHNQGGRPPQWRNRRYRVWAHHPLPRLHFRRHHFV